MTSSLVGSEMCIRDRSLAREAPPAQPAHGMSALAALAVSMARALAPEEAVSYTHLTLPTICSV
eukprot:11813304-Prorocentrum_lima.AAC.1